jgi:hypothetical protein
MRFQTAMCLHPSDNKSLLEWIRPLSAFVAILCAAIFSISSRRWLLVGDASLMHYVVFLIHKGWVPYKDIVDINLPGTYVTEWTAMHLFGTGSLAWRLFDIAVGLGIGVAMTAIAWPQDRFAGPLAGATFFLIHGRDGMNELGQRDLIMTLFLMTSMALFLAFLRGGRASRLIVAGTLAGFASIIKPTAVFFWIAMLVYLLFRTMKTGRPQWQTWTAALLPFFLAPGLAVVYLAERGALGSFWSIATTLIPLHNQLLRFPRIYFLLHPFPSTLIPLLSIWLVATAIDRRKAFSRFSDSEILLLLGVICGLLSFYLQRKALPYHRYPADAFFILLACLSFCRTLRENSSSAALRFVAAIGLLFTGLVTAPQCLLRSFKLHASPNDFSSLLERDLTGLGGPALNRNVQCIDFTAGCVTTLYRMRLEQSTGVLYDCYMFQPDPSPVVRRYREQFWNELSSSRPAVLVLTDHDCGHRNNFQKIDRWPALASLIENRYELYKEVHPPDLVHWASNAEAPYHYRIYLRRESDLLHQARTNPSSKQSVIVPQPLSAPRTPQA